MLDLGGIDVREIATALTETAELDFMANDPVPSYVPYRDMADFAEGISDGAAGRRLAATLQEPGAFHRFKNQLYEHLPELISP